METEKKNTVSYKDPSIHPIMKRSPAHPSQPSRHSKQAQQASNKPLVTSKPPCG